MNILLQNSIFYPNVIGGAELSSHLLGTALRRRGHSVDAVASTGRHGGGSELTTRPTDDGLGTVYEAPAHGLCDILPAADRAGEPHLLRRGVHHFASVWSPRWLEIFGRVLATVRPDIVHTNTIVGLTPAIWAAARRHGVPVVHTIRDYHLLCARTTLLRSTGRDCVDPPLPCRVLARLKLARTGDVALVTAPSRFVLDRHQTAGGFLDVPAAVVPNALEAWPEVIPDREAGGPVRGLFLGQIDTHKGIPELLAALTRLFAEESADLGFDFAGAGPLVDDVRAFCAAHPARARYHGVVGGDDKWALLRGASFLVVPSVWAEPFARAIIDGFSWGLPAIGADRGGIPEVITDGVDGQLVEPEAAELHGAIGRYARDHALRLRHGAAARARAVEFTLDRQAERFESLYEDIIAGAHGPAHQGEGHA